MFGELKRCLTCLLCPLVAECMGEPAAELVIFLGEPANAFVGCLQPGQQGGVGGALTGGDRWRWRTPGSITKPFDFRSEVRLGIEKGPGNAGVAGDGFERNSGAAPVEFS